MDTILLAYDSFPESADILTVVLLGQQIESAADIITILHELEDNPPRSEYWHDHPAVKAWKGYEVSLAFYGLVMAEIREKKNPPSDTRHLIEFFQTHLDYASSGVMDRPFWFGRHMLHTSHQAELMRQDPDQYWPMFGDKVSFDQPLQWS